MLNQVCLQIFFVLGFCIGVWHRGFALGFCVGVLHWGSALGFCIGVLCWGFCAGVLRLGFRSLFFPQFIFFAVVCFHSYFFLHPHMIRVPHGLGGAFSQISDKKNSLFICWLFFGFFWLFFFLLLFPAVFFCCFFGAVFFLLFVVAVFLCVFFPLFFGWFYSIWQDWDRLNL